MKEDRLRLGCSITFVILIIIVNGLVSYFIEGKALSDTLYDLAIMIGNLLIVVGIVVFVVAIIAMIYRKK